MVGSVVLRDYQKECVYAIEKHFLKNHSQLIQMPTGSGKTIVFLNYLSKNSRKSLIVCPSKDLVLQTYERSKLFFQPENVFAKTSSVLANSDHYILTAASLWRGRTLDFMLTQNIDTLVLDECHHSCSKEYLSFIQKLRKKNPHLKILGFTATPERLDKGDLLFTFEKITFQMNILDLIEKGHLCDIRAYKIKTGQAFSDKSISGGDFTKIALKELDNESRNSLIVKTYLEYCNKKKTLIFCVNIEHAEKLAIAMNEKGIKCMAIHGKLTTAKRKYIIEKFRDGEIDVVTNCQLLTEGFDEPSIENLIIARPTKSKSLYSQMIGRGLRNHPGKKICELYELADNSHNILTFDCLAFEDKKIREYPDGISLSSLRKEVEKLSINIENLHAEKILLLKKQERFKDLKYVHEIFIYYKNTYDINRKTIEYFSVEKLRRKFPHLIDWVPLTKLNVKNLEYFLEASNLNNKKFYTNYDKTEDLNLMTIAGQVTEILIKDGLEVDNIFKMIAELVKNNYR